MSSGKTPLQNLESMRRFTVILFAFTILTWIIANPVIDIYLSFADLPPRSVWSIIVGDIAFIILVHSMLGIDRIYFRHRETLEYFESIRPKPEA